MARRFVLPLALLAALVLAGQAAAAQRVLWPGVTFERGVQLTPNGPVALSILRGPRPGGATTLQPLLSNETLVGRETLTAMERRLAATATTAGVNGDYFALATGTPSGVLMRDGVLLAPPRATRSSAGITSDGTLDVRRVALAGTWRSGGATHPLQGLNELPPATGTSLFTEAFGTATPAVAGAVSVVLFPFPAALPGTPLTGVVGEVRTDGAPVEIPPGGAVLVARGAQATTLQAEALPGVELTVALAFKPDWPGVVAAIGGGPQIVRAGGAVFRAGEVFTPIQLGQRAPRTAIGQTADGRVLLVTADGRRPGVSVGFSNFELAQAMVRLGAVTAMALDGGGSTTMAFDGTLLNAPSDGRERPISTALVLAYTGVFVPEVPARVSPNGDGIADDPGLAVRVVRPSRVTTRLTGPAGVVTSATEERTPGTTRVTLPAVASAVRAPAGRRAVPLATSALGTWRLDVTAVDDLRQTTTMTRSFVVDDTLGFLAVRAGLVVRPTAPASLPVSFRLAREARVSVRIESATGTLVRSLVATRLPAGDQRVTWDGRGRNGRPVPSGSYVVHVAATGPVGRSDLTAPVRVRAVAVPAQ